jgi:hypothetical protein
MNAGTGKKRTLTGVLGELYRSRGLLLGALAITLGMLLMLTAPSDVPLVTNDPDGRIRIEATTGVLDIFHLYDVGVALFQTGLVITIFQVLLNQIADDRFVEQVGQALESRERFVEMAVARSLAVGENLEHLHLSSAELDRVIENASRLRSGSEELGKVISRKLRTGVFESKEIWRNLVVRADIVSLESADETGRSHDYYSVYFQFGYHTTNTKRTRFTVAVARWQEEYDRVLRSPEFGAAWRLPSTGEFDDDWTAAFSLSQVAFAGRSVTFHRDDVDRGYVAHVPIEDFADRDETFVQFSFQALVLADGNLLSFEVPHPTYGATYSVSVGVDDIERIRGLDYFGLTRPASIDYVPDLQAPRILSVCVDDWILPRAGLVVVWKRRS